MASKKKDPLVVDSIKHTEATRKNIPTAEYQSVMKNEEQSPVRVAYERRNRDLDPQLVWRGKDEQDLGDLVVQAPPLYIQEKVHPKVLIDDLKREAGRGTAAPAQVDMFSDFNGLPSENAKTEFYQHDAHWSNRMILGDSLQVMASLAEREGLRGKVQCIYFDPPYGIKFNSNFQWSTTSRDVKDGNAEHITREPEQVKAFRDTWRDGIHSYLTYLRDRVTLARDLLSETGSIFVQIGDENVHRVRGVLEEVFGDDNFVALITFKKTGGQTTNLLAPVSDYLVWFAKNKECAKFRQIFKEVRAGEGHSTGERYDQILYPTGEITPASAVNGILPVGARHFRYVTLSSNRPAKAHEKTEFRFKGRAFYPPPNRTWTTTTEGLTRIAACGRVHGGERSLNYAKFIDDFPAFPMGNLWDDVSGSGERWYVVQTSAKVIQRCMLMTTDPGDLVLDPTCGSGTTAYVAEQWGRRWITIDTSRVALALARARIMGTRYPFYLLADSKEGQQKEAEVTQSLPATNPTWGNIRQGFVYERVPHITLKSIANNEEIDTIWDDFQTRLEPLREQLNQALKRTWQEWEIPRNPDDKWAKEVKEAHAAWWQERIARQKKMDAAISAKAEFEFLYDKPYEDKKKVRVAGPFTVESLSPHRMLTMDENDQLVNQVAQDRAEYVVRDFAQIILENLKTAGVQQAHKEDKINFTALTPWPGELICADGRYQEGDNEKRAAIFIGPEFGTVARQDLVRAAREAGDAGFDVLIACAFNYEAHCTEFEKLGRIMVLKARMNADLHMAEDLKNTGKGNLFVIFGEPDIDILPEGGTQIRVKINGVDVFHPNSGEIRSDGAEGIACWFIDTDYNEESFFVRHAYFLGANDPYKALKTTLKAEINEEAWATLNSDISRAFDKPATGRIAVKVINHLGDEVMKVFKVE